MLIFDTRYLQWEDIPQLIALDQKVYPPEYQVDEETTRCRWKRNHQTDLIIKDQEQIIGYITLLPIPSPLFHQMMDQPINEEYVDLNILPFDHPGSYDAYLESIVLDKKSYPHFSGKWLFINLERHLRNLQRRGIFIRHILAWAVSPMGRKTLQKMRFTEVSPNRFVYDCRTQGIVFVVKVIVHFVPSSDLLWKQMDFPIISHQLEIDAWFWDRDT